jgi:phosphoribosylaminoimidazolecarboxamide formyltransferase/IMP cyclohydrolase
MRALLSVYDKAGLVEFATGLIDLGWELVSSGGTATAIREAGLAVLDVAEVTQAPEMLDGRVKTLHPAIHGGILADRSKPEHMATLDERGIAAIDLVAGNLYPFTSQPGVEMIDIGGPTMVRAAAKNFDAVAIVVDPGDYSAVLAELGDAGTLATSTRRQLARKAFAHTAAYDAAIVEWLDATDPEAAEEAALPETLHLAFRRDEVLRYGENPHQVGARYTPVHGATWWDSVVQHGGKAMSYLNVYDTEAAWRLVHHLGDGPAAVVIKHANPCGAAVGDNLTEAYTRAHACDDVSAFGGIVAVNGTLPASLAEALAPVFTEVVIAPSYEPEALEILQAKKNLRVLEAQVPEMADLEMRSIGTGLLVQTPDVTTADPRAWTVATKREPTAEEWVDLELAWRVVSRVSSNSIVLVKDGQAVGIGAGQQNRRDAGRIAADKANGRAVGGACASDAFFPFRDGLDAAAEAGATAVVQPGGSIRDDEVIEAANEQGLAMVFTGERHFKH